MRTIRDADQRDVHPGDVHPSDLLPPGDEIEVLPDIDPPAADGIRRWWHGRFGYRMALEVVLVVVLLSIYRHTRYLAKEHTGPAFDNARNVLGLERHLGIDNEQSLQRAALDHLWFIRGLNRYYVSVHFPATVGFLVYLYVRAPEAYRPIRRLFVAVTATALAIHVVYPLAPPRMLPGYVDTVTRFGPAVYEDPRVAGTVNQFAAMPSLHFGWALLVAYGLINSSNSRWRHAIVAHPITILVAIIITANHYWLDAAVAGALVAGAIGLRFLLAPPEIEPT